jgi:nicotinamidase-related amidase
MVQTLAKIFLVLFTLQSTLAWAYTNCAKPDSFLKPSEHASIIVEEERVLFVTHSSTHFDPARVTSLGMNKLVSYAKREGIPYYYLHDSVSPNNPFHGYMYEHCEPDAFLDSDIGYHSVNLRNVKQLYVAGGFFEMCQQNTVTDAIRSMSQNQDNNVIKVTQVVDAIFSVAEEKEYSDPFWPKLYELQQNRTMATGKFTISLRELVDTIENSKDVLNYLARRVNKMPLPAGWSVDITFKGQSLVVREGDQEKRIEIEFIFVEDLEK